MLELNLTILGEGISECNVDSIIHILHDRIRIPMDSGNIHYSPVADYPAITCHIYLPTSEFWQDFFSQVRQIRRYFEEQLDKQVWQIIISLSEQDNYQSEAYYPSYQYLSNHQGIWIYNNIMDIIPLLREANARLLEGWLFFSFNTDEIDRDDTDESDGDYELCTPSELQEIGNRINGSVRRISVPIELRVRLAEGYKLSDYISATFNQTLKSLSPNQDSESALTLGGLNAVLTTILQMNNKLDLVNYYSEKLTNTEDINLYSLSAMNLSLVDDRDETNIAVLVSSGQLIIEDIKLG